MTKNYALFLLNQLCAGASVDAKPIIPQFELAQALSVAIKVLEQEPCEDCISRKAVKEQMIKYGFKAPDMTVTEFVEDCLPSVTPTRPTAHWILLDECLNSGYYCSECHKKVIKEGWSNTVKKVKYCPNCGARMAESEEENG